MGELVGDAAAGLGWGEPADGQAQGMQVHVAHSFKVEAVGIHEGRGRERKALSNVSHGSACGCMWRPEGPRQEVRTGLSRRLVPN